MDPHSINADPDLNPTVSSHIFMYWRRKKTKFKHFWYLERKKIGIRIRISKLYKRRFEFHFLICVPEKNGCYGLSNKKNLFDRFNLFLD